MKKARLLAALLLLAMLFSLASASAYAEDSHPPVKVLTGSGATNWYTDGTIRPEKSLDRNENSMRVINVDPSKAAMTFTAIDAKGWDTDNLTLGGVAYEPFITDRGYMLVRNGELTQAALAPKVAKALGDDLGVDDLVIKDSELALKKPMDILSNEKLLDNLQDYDANSLIDLNALLDALGMFLNKIKTFDHMFPAEGKETDADYAAGQRQAAIKFLNMLENEPNSETVVKYMKDGHIAEYVEKIQEKMKLMVSGRFGETTADLLKKIKENEENVELNFTDGENTVQFKCANLDQASNPLDQRYPCTACGSNPCVCQPYPEEDEPQDQDITERPHHDQE